MKCSICKFYNICKGRLSVTVDNCARFKPLEQTNDEWRKTCSAKEFAEFISSILDYGFGIDYAPVNPMGEDVDTIEDIEKWLKQPHREETEK